MSVVWPKEIELPEKIGKGKYDLNGEPCCAFGHIRRVIKGEQAQIKWRRAFVTCAGALTPRAYGRSVEGVNDQVLSPKERLLVYAATLIYIGYEIEDWPEARELADRARQGGEH